MSLTFEPGLAERYRNLRDCLATQIYQRGHGRVAGKLDLAPSHLTEKLAGASSDGKSRCITVDELEVYLEHYKDFTPIYYLLDKFVRDPQIRQQEALARLPDLIQQLTATFVTAGGNPKSLKR